MSNIIFYYFTLAYVVMLLRYMWTAIDKDAMANLLGFVIGFAFTVGFAPITLVLWFWNSICNEKASR